MKMGVFLAAQPVVACSSQITTMKGKPLHHTNKGFRNYPVTPPPKTPGFGFMLRRIGALFSTPEIPEDHYLPEEEALAGLGSAPGSPAITWIGHSTFLLRAGNKTLLLDPFFSDLASPLPIGPERIIAPGIALKNLPPIDAIILSHSHYDHLDEDTIENLPGRQKIHVYAPLGLKPFFVERGYRQVTELDWHQSVQMEDTLLTALPAVHFSNRWINDRNRTLWCSWAIRTPTANIYFAGDTAYSDKLFKEIGQTHGPFDMAIVPIGAYEPVNVMKPVHTNPEEAIQVANDVKADIIVPAHWGTIELSDEPLWEPPERYRQFASKNGIPDDRAWLLKIGETRTL